MQRERNIQQTCPRRHLLHLTPVLTSISCLSPRSRCPSPSNLADQVGHCHTASVEIAIWAGPDVIALKKGWFPPSPESALTPLMQLPEFHILWTAFFSRGYFNVFGPASNPHNLQCKIQKRPTPCCCLHSSLRGRTLPTTLQNPDHLLRADGHQCCAKFTIKQCKLQFMSVSFNWIDHTLLEAEVEFEWEWWDE